MLDGVVSTLEFTGDAKLADSSVGILPFQDADGKLQVRRLIESGNAVFKMTAPQEGEVSDLTIFDQTWRQEGDDNGPIHGIATVSKREYFGGYQLLTKIILYSYFVCFFKL